MSIYVIAKHGSAYFTCDFIGGKPEHRSACRAAITVRSNQGALWLDPSCAELPTGWVRASGGHLCGEHAGRVPTDGHVAALTFSGSAS